MISPGMHHGQPCCRCLACYFGVGCPIAAAGWGSISFAAVVEGGVTSSFAVRVTCALAAGSLESQVAVVRTGRIVVGDTAVGDNPAAAEDNAGAGHNHRASGPGTEAQGCRKQAGRNYPAAADEWAPLVIPLAPDTAMAGHRSTPGTLQPGSGRTQSAD